MRRIYAAVLRPTAEGWFPKARATIRYSAARPHGGWPRDASISAERGTWKPAPEVAIDWNTVISGADRGFRLRIDEPFTDDTLRLHTVITAVDAQNQPRIAIESFAVSTTTELTGTVVYENTAPDVAAQLCEHLDLIDGPYSVDPDVVDLANDEAALATMICDPARSLPVVVVVGADLIGGAGVDLLGPALAGIAHVAVVDRASATRLHDDLRVVMPSHSVVGLFWPDYVPGSTAKATYWNAAQARPSDHAVPAWPTVRTLYAAAAIRLNAGDRFDRLEKDALRTRLSTARAQERSVEEFNEVLATWEADLVALESATERSERAERLADELRAELDAAMDMFAVALEAQRTTSGPPGAETPATTAFESVVDAVRQAAADASHLVILPEALETAEGQCAFLRPGDVYTDLMAADRLARRWAEDQLEPGGLTATAMREGLVWRSGVSKTALGKYRADYLIDVDGNEVLLGPHFGRGANSSNHYRAYVHLDRARRRILVGYVGRHLRDASNS